MSRFVSPCLGRKPLQTLLLGVNLRFFRVEHGVCLSVDAPLSKSRIVRSPSALDTSKTRRAFMRRRGFHLVVAVLAACLLASTHAFAQGGGASTTGSINGKVSDTSQAVLPGVTVTVASPSLMGVQTAVTDGGGNYRFPALPPGTYTVTFELPGFNTLKRENIQIAMGFTAAVNVELAVASLQETVTVTGDSPVIDTTSTRVQQNFKLEALQEIPNSRDLWSLLAVTPAVTMGRID